MFANLKIGHRLALGFAGALAFSVVITGNSLWKMKGVAAQVQSMTESPLSKERYTADWSRNISTAVARTTAVAKSSDPSLSTFFAADTAATMHSTSELLKKLEVLLSSDEEKALFAKIVETRKSYSTYRDTVFKLKAEGKADEANQVLEAKYLPAAKNYQDLVAQFLGLQRRQLNDNAVNIKETEIAARNEMIALSALVILFGIGCAWWLTVGITGPLRNAVAAARRVADGDLSGNIEVTSSDETGQLLKALRDMNANLLMTVTKVRQGTETIASASNQIAAGNQDLSARTEQQASSLEETASSMEELTSTVRQNADNARQANQLADVASQVAAKGGKVIGEVVGTMGDINASARKIVDIIAVIDGIAFQTNILALNAAVEAARAGEQGRGFAVVASEVRTLAQRSASAAKEIKGLIEASVDQVDAGSMLVNQAGKTMADIVDSVRRVTDIMSEITAASQEQTSGIEQINQAITQMDDVTQQNASLVEEAAAASEAMQQQAAELAKVVSVFRIDGGKVRTSLVSAPTNPSRAGTTVAHKSTRTLKVRHSSSGKSATTVSERRSLSSIQAGKDGDWEEF